MRYFPAFLDLDRQPALLVGGGEPAARKLRLLLKAGARVTLVAPGVTAEIAALAAEGRIALRPRAFRADDLDEQSLAVSATGLDAVDRAVAAAARAARLPVNVVDRPDLGSFITPAIVDRDPVVIGISTGGASPVLARRLRAAIEALLPSGLGRLARFAESFRGAVGAMVPDAKARRLFWEGVFDGPVARRVLAGEESAAREAMISLINRPMKRPIDRGRDDRPSNGSVAIVGAGPGDPDLLTLRALSALQTADVVVHDRLVGPEILDRARRDAERIFVGKAKGRHAASQDEINGLLLDLARAGKRVVRLKGGDPFVFGRGGEEADFLRRHAIEVELVPGITAATACAAAAGIPLTHRGLAQAVTFVTGHGAGPGDSPGEGGGAPEVDWAALARPGHTLAVYMGLSTAGTVARRLIEGGLSAATPVAAVEKGSLPGQRVATGTLGGLEALLRDAEIEGPALILVGEVVRLGDAAVPGERLAESPPPRAAAG